MPLQNPPHPGGILKDAVEAIPMTLTEFADHIGMSRVALSRVVNCRSGISAELSVKLNQAFGQEQPDFWFSMQNAYDFWQVSQTKRKPVKRIGVAA